MKQSPYIASWRGTNIGFPWDTSKFKRFNQIYSHPQEAQRNLIKQPRQKVWCCKVMRAQDQQQTVTACSCLNKPCEECYTFSGGKPGTENKKHSSVILQGASRVLWKPKQMLFVQVSKEKCKEEGKDNPSSSASQKKRARGECPLAENPDNTPLSSPNENEQQFNKQASSTLTPQMKDPSDMCPIASCSNAPPSPLCGSGQQVENMGNQGLTKPASQSGMALEELDPADVSSSSCESGQHISDVDKKAVFGPTSQPVSVVAMSLKPEDAPLTKGVMKPHRNSTSWRRKTPSVRNIAVTSASSKEANENDPLVSMHVEGASEKHSNTLPTGISVASNDLHVRKSIGRHMIRASYGLPSQFEDCSQLQKPVDHQVKFHADGAFSLELPNKANTTCLDGESPRASKSETMNEMKHTKISPSWLHPDSKSKFSQHHAYAVKQAHFIAGKQHTTVSNRRPFSMKANFSHDDNKKIVHHQRPLLHMCSPMEQSYRTLFFRKPNFLNDYNKRAAHHQHAPKHTGQIKMSENSHARGSNYVESLGRSKSDSDVKPVRHGQLHSGRKFADSDKKGWVVKTEAR